MFESRVDAGDELGHALAQQLAGRPAPLVLGIPRGGVAVAARVAAALAAPLDVAIAAKIAAPDAPEFAIGAVAADGRVVASGPGWSIGELERFAAAAREKVARETALLRAGRPQLDLRGRTVVIVDDGLATGLTAIAAAEWAHREGADRVIVAVPVTSSSAKLAVLEHADAVISVLEPAYFRAVGEFYRDFAQTTDAEVAALLGIGPDASG